HDVAERADGDDREHVLAADALAQHEGVLRADRDDERETQRQPGEGGGESGGCRHAFHAKPRPAINPVQDSAEALASLQMNLDRDQLATLRAVVDAGTFDAAATALSITPSAVSQRIKALEQQLGRVLVERTKPVRATESGEVLLRLAREIALLEADAAAALRLDDSDEGFTSVPLAVNADSLTSWFLPAIASVCTERRIVVDIHREDQDRTAELLASGRVMAAVTSRADPVAGCSSTPLGVLVYHPAASRAFAERWFRDGADAASFARAPVVDFDHDDE